MTRPLVTVAIPLYNRESMIARALESVLQQDYRPLAVVVVDDGSTDQGPEVVERTQAPEGVELRLIRQPNQGCASARNTGWRSAEEGLILFLDSDDELLPGAVTGLYETAEKSGADMVCAPSLEVLPDGQVLRAEPASPDRPEDFARRHFFSNRARTGAMLYRRELLDKVGGFWTELGHNEDSDLVQRASLQGRVTYYPDPTVRVHHHGGKKSLNRPAIHRAVLLSAQRVLKEHPEFAAGLGAEADDLVRDLHLRLAAAHVRSGDFASAKDLVKDLPTPWALSLSLGLGTAFPLRVYARLKGRPDQPVWGGWWLP